MTDNSQLMYVLVVGGTGATGRWLVDQLTQRGCAVTAVVRHTATIPHQLTNNDRVTLVEADLLELTDEALDELVAHADAIVSCLGHNISFKGIYGQPRRLVTDATRRLCEAIVRQDPEQPKKFVLMNTVGNRNKDLDEQESMRTKIVKGLLRLLLPPHPDNEQAADYLRTAIGQNHGSMEWVAVRPSGLIDSETVTDYSEHPSPTRDPIFDDGQISRINVAHFMARLITDENTWSMWKGQMPVLYLAE